MAKNRTNADWLIDLSARGAQQTGALEDLRQLLLRAAQKTFSSYLGDLQGYPPGAVAELSDDCAQEALIAVLDHLEDFQGDSKFTTWAYKFAVNIALTAARRERQKFVPRDLTKKNLGLEEWLFDKAAKAFPDPEVLALKEEVWTVIRSVIQNDLTPRQREVMKLMIFDEVPMDKVVERLRTNRNAVYKLLHDGRRKIKIRLLARGIELQDALSIFGEEK